MRIFSVGTFRIGTDIILREITPTREMKSK